MHIFDIINDVCSVKKGNLHSDSEFANVVPSGYMLQRWTSMVDSGFIQQLNETSNRYQLDKVEMYKMLVSSIPLIKRRRFKYIKKTKENEKQMKTYEDEAIKNELSLREVKENMELREKITGSEGLT